MQPEVQRIEKCLARKNGVSLFVEVDPSVTILDGHRIGDEVNAALMESI